MTRKLQGSLWVLVLAGAMLSGCQSTPQVEEPPEEVVDTPPPPPPPPPPPLPPGPRLSPNLEPLDADGKLLDSTFYFDYDQARLAPDDIRVLALHARILRDTRTLSVNIEGHCDERGTREYNLALGERRSEAVRRYLISAGVRSTQIETVSFGEERPAAPGHDESAWSKNRRAEVGYRR